MYSYYFRKNENENKKIRMKTTQTRTNAHVQHPPSLAALLSQLRLRQVLNSPHPSHRPAIEVGSINQILLARDRQDKGLSLYIACCHDTAIFDRPFQIGRSIAGIQFCMLVSESISKNVFERNIISKYRNPFYDAAPFCRIMGFQNKSHLIT